MTSNCARGFRSIHSRHFVVKLVTSNLQVFGTVIMTCKPVGFPVPSMPEGVDEREVLECFILDYIDYCTVMGWFVP